MRQCPVPRDALPYSSDFEALKTSYEKAVSAKSTDLQFWRLISNTAKRGGMGKVGARKRVPRLPPQSEPEKLEILRLFPDGIGNRDSIPYTARFDALRRRYGKLTGQSLSSNEFWRRIASVAKLSRKPQPTMSSASTSGLDPDLLGFLERNNPWWRGQPAVPAQFFRRWAYDEAASRLQSGIAKMVVLRGSRRVGKSVIQNQLIDGLLKLGTIDPTGKPVDPSRILAVQFDDAPSLGSLRSPIETIVRWFEQHILKSSLNAAAAEGRPAYLFFDEVQNLPNWSVQLKSLADLSAARIVVTGSSALRIREGHDNLAGRMTPIEIGPLRLGEIAGIRRLGSLPTYAPKARIEDWKTFEFWRGLVEHGRKHAGIRELAFGCFSRLGGYPLCHASPTLDNTDFLRQQLINEVITKTIEHDTSRKPHQVSPEPELLKHVFRMACRYAGQAVQPKRLADEVISLTQVPISNLKINQAIDFLADSLLISAVRPLELLGKGQIHPSKLCICDHYVRNGVLQETIPLDPADLAKEIESVVTQAGHLIESTLGYFLAGIPGLDVASFPPRPTEPEVDFILTIGTLRIPVEVKYRSRPPTIDQLGGIRHFLRKPAYQSAFGLVVTQTYAGLVADDILAIPASTMLLLR